MKRLFAASFISVAALASAPAARAGPPSAQVAWQAAAADADIDRAFVQARAENKPVLLYWGASWCPPCNQLKATLFNRQEFAALSKHFVAVNVDGDLPGAQKLGRRFKVSGYPTTVLFTPAGQEITRLPGEVDAPQALAVLQLGLNGGRPVKAVLADALAGKPLSAGDWKLLAFYSWETDEAQVVPKAELPALLARLAAASPGAGAKTDNEVTTRLWLKALAANDDGQGLKPDAALRERVRAVLANPAQTREHFDALAYGAADIVRTLQPEAGAGRAALAAEFDAAMQRLQADATLSRGNRLDALYARIELARLGLPKDAVQVQLPAALLKDLRDFVAHADREISDGYERQAVITNAGSALGQAGLWAESEALLKANLAKSHSPYYLMSQLGSNARKQGRKAEALNWYGQAFETSVGPATRLQWGASYLTVLVELAPQERQRIEKLASQLLAEAAADKGAFAGRSARSLQKAGAQLVAWNGGGKQAATLKRLQAQLNGVCAQVDSAEGQRQVCQALLKPAPKDTAKKAA